MVVAGPRRWAIALGAAALVVRLPLIVGPHPPYPGSDSAFYLSLAGDILHGHGFSRAGEFYTPGYPAVLAVLRLLPGRTEDAISVMQHLLGVGVVVALVLCGWRWFGMAPALAAGAIAALAPLLPVHEHAILPDFLFGVCVLAGAFLLAEAATRAPPAPWPLVAAAGVAFGAAAWLKPAGEVLVIAAPLALLAATRQWRAAGLVVAAMVLTISPWLVRNAHDYGLPSMSNQGGQTLFNRVFEVDEIPFPSDSRYAPLAQKVRKEKPPRFNSAFRVALVRDEGMTTDHAIATEADIALTAIRRHPGTYAVGTFREVGRSAGDMRDDEEPYPVVRPQIHGRPLPAWLATAPWAVGRVLVDAWWIVTLFGATALIVPFVGPERSRKAGTVLLVIGLGVLFGTALSHGALWRYSMQVAPLAWLLGSAGTAALVRLVVTRTSASPASEPIR